MERRVPIAEAKARFAEWIRRAEGGEAIVLTRHGRPVARLVGTRFGGELAGGGRGPARPAAEVAEAELAYGERERLPAAAEARRESLGRLLEEEIWPRVPEQLLGRGLAKREREEILGLDEGEP